MLGWLTARPRAYCPYLAHGDSTLLFSTECKARNRKSHFQTTNPNLEEGRVIYSLTPSTPAKTDIPDAHSSVTSRCLVKASSTVRSHLLSPTPAQRSRSRPPPSLGPPTPGETLPRQELCRSCGHRLLLSCQPLLVTTVLNMLRGFALLPWGLPISGL